MPFGSGLGGVWEAPGPEQAPKDAVPVSIEQAKVEPPSVEWKVKVGVWLVVVPEGPESITAVGGVVSTCHSKVAGEASVLSARSIARTSKRWGPSVRPV